jgi:acyl transferase domain-containing protein
MVVEEVSSFLHFVAKSSLPLPFVISAKDPSTLIKLINFYIDWLKRPSTLSTSLSDISHAMTARRFCHPFMVRAVNTLTHAAPPCTISRPPSPMVSTCFRIAESENLIAEEDISMLELFALEFGLVEMWKSWGIKPVALAGHSFGEYLALVCAGVLTVRDALKLLGIRAALIRARCLDNPGKMAAVRLLVSEIIKCLKQQKSTNVELACINSDNSVTLAGTPDDLESFREELHKSYPAVRLHLLNIMAAAFHSQVMEPILTDFNIACNEVKIDSSKQVVLSGLLGKMCPMGDDALQQRDYLI